MTLLRSLLLLVCVATASLEAAEAPTFGKRLAEANRLLDEGKLEEALSAAKGAAQIDTNRFEAPFLATVIFLELKKPEQARLAFDSALALAPADKKPKLEALRKELEAMERTPAKGATASAKSRASGRQLDALMLIIEEADRATLDSERKKLLNEFLQKSEPFLKENPDELPLWTVRAVAALELNKKQQGWEAGKQLRRLAAENIDDAKLRKVMASLERKGWFADQLPNADYSKMSPEDLRRAGDDGEAEAQYRLGQQAQQDLKDENLAILWYGKAAESGHAGAQGKLGWLLILKTWASTRLSPSGKRLDEKGLQWLHRAAEGGSWNDAYNMGLEYSHGNSFFPRDDSEALKWLRFALDNVPGSFAHQVSNHVHLVFAWKLSTSPADTLRSGQQALVHAHNAVASSDPKTFRFQFDPHEVLAAAYAETGDFQKGVGAIEKAIASAKALDDSRLVERYRKQLKSYQKRKPWRE